MGFTKIRGIKMMLSGQASYSLACSAFDVPYTYYHLDKVQSAAASSTMLPGTCRFVQGTVVDVFLLWRTSWYSLQHSFSDKSCDFSTLFFMGKRVSRARLLFLHCYASHMFERLVLCNLYLFPQRFVDDMHVIG